MDRNLFLKRVALGAGGLLASPQILFAKKSSSAVDPLPAEKVKEFVIAGHGNLPRVKEMLLETPALLYSTWDWGGGDFETALEGAGHVGNKEIAHYLIAAGARANLFVLTMLGKTKMVKNFLKTFPEYIRARGPHGLTLLHHAQKGGEDSKVLLAYLQSKGLTEAKMVL